MPTERNLRDIRKRGAEVENRLGLYLQLVGGGSRKINLGESSVTFTASAESAIKEIEHGLGVKPVYVGAMLEATTGTTLIAFRTTERTTTKFKLFANASSAISGTFTVGWIALG